MAGPSTETITIPLRFPRSQARVLDSIVDTLEQRSVQAEDVMLFKQAAKAAREGEPLLVECVHPSEAVAIADGFVTFGTARPTVG